MIGKTKAFSKPPSKGNLPKNSLSKALPTEGISSIGKPSMGGTPPTAMPPTAMPPTPTPPTAMPPTPMPPKGATTKRTLRVGEMLKRSLALLFAQRGEALLFAQRGKVGLKQSLPVITLVTVSPDLNSARVYFTLRQTQDIAPSAQKLSHIPKTTPVPKTTPTPKMAQGRTSPVTPKTTPAPNPAEQLAKELNAQAALIRHYLKPMLRLPRLPKLRFYYDETVEKAHRLNLLLDANK